MPSAPAAVLIACVDPPPRVVWYGGDPCIGHACLESCADGVDNDLNGKADCTDESCWCTVDCNCDADGDGYISDEMGGTDCLDTDPDAHPDAVEYCNGIDDDCDAHIDDDDPDLVLTIADVYWYDADFDGFGDPNVWRKRCTASLRWVRNGDDCDDQNDTVHPGAVELCGDDIDNDCDGLLGSLDDNVEKSGPAWWPDADGDGYGDQDGEPNWCYRPPGYVDNDEDCADAIPAKNPSTLWYPDLDDDGYGDQAGVPVQQCERPAGYGRLGWPHDCDDGDPAVHPEQVDGCDLEDSDCDGLVDEDSPAPNWVFDADGDGLGMDAWAGDPTCTSPGEGWADGAVGTDCDDADASVGAATAWYVDADGDGFGDEELGAFCDAPPGAVAVGGDCDDDDVAIPAPFETCIPGDDDCDGLQGLDDDDIDLSTFLAGWVDRDRDGVGDATAPAVWCELLPEGVAAVAGDCDDGNPSVLAGLAYVLDGDGDGVRAGPEVAADPPCTPPGDGWVDAAAGVDCDDLRSGAFERHGNGLDDDCDGLVDELLFVDLSDGADLSWSGANSFGGSIASLPDLDGDGVPELLVGAPFANSEDGLLYRAALDGTAAPWIEGSRGSRLGFVAPAAGDLNGDGAADVILGAPYAEFGGAENSGAVRLFNGPVEDGFASRDFAASQAVVGGLGALEYFGWSYDVGDLDGDGVADLLVGTNERDGRVLAFAGPLDAVATSADWAGSLEGASSLGESVVAVGDMDGDGVVEWAAGAPTEGVGGITYLFSGMPQGPLSVEDAVGSLESIWLADQVGASLAALGDVTGDGLPDLGVGAPFANPINAGALIVVSGPPVGPISGFEAPAVLLSLVDGATCSWTKIGAPGDLDGDGVDDAAVPCHSRALHVQFGPLSGHVDVDLAPAVFQATSSFLLAAEGMDFDGDGAADPVVADPLDERVFQFFGPL